MPVETALSNNDMLVEGRSITRGIILRRTDQERAEGAAGTDNGQLAIAASQSATMGNAPIRRNGVPTEWDMQYIRQLSPNPDALKPESLYVFESAPSNQQIDSLLTRMDVSSLQNYSQDAFGGVAVMNSHRTGISSPATLPVGRSFYGAVEDDPSYAGTKRFVAAAYILRNNRASGENTDDIIAGIESGTIFDNSIGFRMIPGTVQNNWTDRSWYRCSICDADWTNDGPQSGSSGGMFGNLDDSKTGCNHWPGELYDHKMCYLWVMNARLAEFSLVYAGATDGAVILKARKAASRGDLSRGQVRRLENIYHARIAGTTLYAAPVNDFLRPVQVPTLEELPEREEVLVQDRGADQDVLILSENTNTIVESQTTNNNELAVPVSGLPLESTTDSEREEVAETQETNSTKANILAIIDQRDSSLSDADFRSATELYAALITKKLHRAQELMQDFSEPTETPDVNVAQNYGGTSVNQLDSTNRANGKKTTTEFNAPTDDQDELVTGDKPSKYPHVANHDASESNKPAGTVKKPKVGKVTAPANNRDDEDQDESLELADSDADESQELSDDADESLELADAGSEDEELTDDADESQELADDADESQELSDDADEETERLSGKGRTRKPAQVDDEDEGDEGEIAQSSSRSDRKVKAPAGCMDPDCDTPNCDNAAHMQGRAMTQKKIPTSKSTDWDDNMGDGEEVPEGEIKSKLKGAIGKNTTKRDLKDIEDDEDDDVAPTPGSKARTQSAASDKNRVVRPSTAPTPVRNQTQSRDQFAEERQQYVETIARFKTKQLDANERYAIANERIVELERQVRKLSKEAEVGRFYRSNLIAECITYAARAEIAGMDESRINRMFKNMDIEDIKVFRDDYQMRAEAKYGQLNSDGTPVLVGGRQTQAADPNADYLDVNQNWQRMIQPFTAHPSNDDKVGSTFSLDGFN